MENREKRGKDLDCPCQTTVIALHRQTMASSFEITVIFDIAGSLISVFEESGYCTKGCRRTRQYIKLLLDSVSSLMALFDIIWYQQHSEQASVKIPPRPTHNITAADFSLQGRTQAHSPAPPVVTGYQTMASIGGFVFDESEKHALLEEILRSLTRSMNNVVKTIQQYLPRAITDPHTAERANLSDLCAEVLDKTYSAKGRY